jgi:hypothetical protein
MLRVSQVLAAAPRSDQRERPTIETPGAAQRPSREAVTTLTDTAVNGTVITQHGDGVRRITTLRVDDPYHDERR